MDNRRSILIAHELIPALDSSSKEIDAALLHWSEINARLSRHIDRVSAGTLALTSLGLAEELRISEWCKDELTRTNRECSFYPAPIEAKLQILELYRGQALRSIAVVLDWISAINPELSMASSAEKLKSVLLPEQIVFERAA